MNATLFYQFGCNAHGEGLIVHSGGPTMGALMSPEPLSCHLGSNAIMSTSVLESTTNITELQHASANATALVVEIWMTTQPVTDKEDAASQVEPIFVIGDSYAPTNTTSTDRPSDCDGFHLALAQRGGYLEIRYVDQNAAKSCRILVLRDYPLKPHTMQQVLLVLDHKSNTNVYFDGIPVVHGAPNQFDATLSTWNPTSTLQLFGSNTFAMTERFHGSINMLSIYSQTVSATEALAFYNQGLIELEKAWDEREPLQLLADFQPAILTQGVSSPFWVGGHANLSSFNTGGAAENNELSMYVEILSLPKFGYLRSDDYGVIAHPGQRLPLQGLESQTKLWYRPESEEYFNIPLYTFGGQSLNQSLEFFAFRLIAVANSTQQGQELLVGCSETVNQDLVVVHVNHPSLLTTPDQVVVASAQTGAVQPRAYLEGVDVNDEADHNIDRVRVDIWAYNGTLTIAEELLTLADFASCRASERYTILGTTPTWNCHGTGMGNRNLTFVAAPRSLSQILSHIQYDGFYWDQPDTIVLRIFDGGEGPCLSFAEHQQVALADPAKSYSTMHNPECFEIVASVNIPAIPRPKSSTSTTRGYLREFFDIDDFGLADGLFWIIFVSVLSTSCIFLRSCIRCWGARGTKIHVDGMGVKHIATNGANQV